MQRSSSPGQTDATCQECQTRRRDDTYLLNFLNTHLNQGIDQHLRDPVTRLARIAAYNDLREVPGLHEILPQSNPGIRP